MVWPVAELEAVADQAGISLQQRPQDIAPSAWVALAAGLNRLHQGMAGEERDG